MNKRFLSGFTATLLAVAILAGCGGSKPASAPAPAPAPSSSQTSQAEAPKPPEPPKPTNLVVYSALAEYETSRMLDAFQESTGIKVEFIRLSSGQLAARVQAEKGSPKADIILGGPSETHEALIPEGLLQPYLSSVRSQIDAKYHHPEGYWSGFYVGALGIALNTARFEKEFPGEKEPETWDDLLNPKFSKSLTIATPAASGTAYNFVATQIFRLGEEKAWEFLDNLHPNVAQYTTSGAAPALQAASGEFTLGMAFGHDIMKPMNSGYKVKLIYPKQTGWEIGAVSIIKGGPNPRAAEMFVDWMLGREAGQIHTDLSLRISTRSDVKLPPGAITLDKIDLVKYDNKWAGEHRARIVEEWNKRFSK